MGKIKSVSTKRLIIQANVNDKTAYFLLDTGASVGLIDKNQQSEYNLVVGKKYNGKLIGAGGEISHPRICDTFVEFEGKFITQFILADIGDIVESIKKETNIKILGIISLSQMSFIGINIDLNSLEIWLE